MGESKNTVPLNKEDLYLLLESYENQINSNRTLMEQQSKLLEQHNQILDKQKEICENVSTVIENMSTHATNISKEKQELDKVILNNKNKCTNDHSSIVSKIHLLYVGIGAIVITLLGLLYNTYDKFEILKDIAKHLGVY